MLLWFAVVAPVIVAEVFRSPMVDYRVVALGAVLPVGEAVLGGPRVLHTLVGAVLVLAIVMLSSRHRRLLRRRMLGLAIGLFLHLVLDGTWTDQDLLWWPGFGMSFGVDQVPELRHGLAFGLLLELSAMAMAVWAYRRYQLDDEENRSLLIRTGQLNRTVLR